MGRDEQCVRETAAKKSDSRLVNEFLKLDSQTDKTVSVLCAIMLAFTIPSGVKYAIDDLLGKFTPYKAAAEYIRDNIPEDALPVSANDSYSALLTYLPERRIYSTQYGHFYTYCSHEVVPETVDNGELIQSAEKYNGIYYLSYPFGSDSSMEMIYSNQNFIEFYLALDSVAIYRVSDDTANGISKLLSLL